MRRLRLLLSITLVATLAAPVLAGKGRAPLDEAQLDVMLVPGNPVDDAIIAARAEVVANPLSAEALIALGNAFRDGSLVPEALVAFEEATQYDPQNSYAWNNLGIVQLSMGDSKRAARSFQEATSLDPRNAEARYNYAHLLDQNGDFDGAVIELKRALRLRPDLGHEVTNPRAYRSNLMLTTRLSLYGDTMGSNILPTMGPNGESNLDRARELPWLGRRVELQLEQERQAESGTTAGAPPPPPPPPPPQAAPTPIILNPDNMTAAPAGSKASPGSSKPRRSRSSRSPRRGGPGTKRSKD